MRDLQFVGGIKTLNNQNYSTWSTCMMPEKTTTVKTHNQPKKWMKVYEWKIKTGKAMSALKTMIEEDILEHIQDSTTPKEVWDTLACLFSKKMMPNCNFSRVICFRWHNETWRFLSNLIRWNQCHEIFKLELETTIDETRIKRIVIHGLKPEY